MSTSSVKYVAMKKTNKVESHHVPHYFPVHQWGTPIYSPQGMITVPDCKDCLYHKHEQKTAVKPKVNCSASLGRLLCTPIVLLDNMASATARLVTQCGTTGSQACIGTCNAISKGCEGAVNACSVAGDNMALAAEMRIEKGINACANKCAPELKVKTIQSKREAMINEGPERKCPHGRRYVQVPTSFARNDHVHQVPMFVNPSYHYNTLGNYHHHHPSGQYHPVHPHPTSYQKQRNLSKSRSDTSNSHENYLRTFKCPPSVEIMKTHKIMKAAQTQT